ncbi:MAG: YceI family protein [Pseudomonadota bacterium]
MKTPILAAAFATSFVPAFAPAAFAETWGMDPTHTEVLISWNHAGFSIQTAKFLEFDGTLEFTPGDVANASADFSVKVASVHTGVDAFTGHLLGGGFFDAEAYPEITFVSTSVEQTGDMSAMVTGDMTVKDVTKPVTFDVTVHSLGEHPAGRFAEPYEGEWLGFTAVADIKRSDFGVDAFIPVGSDEVTITINSEMRAGGFSF